MIIAIAYAHSLMLFSQRSVKITSPGYLGCMCSGQDTLHLAVYRIGLAADRTADCCRHFADRVVSMLDSHLIVDLEARHSCCHSESSRACSDHTGFANGSDSRCHCYRVVVHSELLVHDHSCRLVDVTVDHSLPTGLADHILVHLVGLCCDCYHLSSLGQRMMTESGTL